jgi:hypothetical protein
MRCHLAKKLSSGENTALGGIATRLLRATFGASPAIVGLDPSADMLREAARSPHRGRVSGFERWLNVYPVPTHSSTSFPPARRSTGSNGEPSIVRPRGFCGPAALSRSCRTTVMAPKRFLDDYERLLVTYSPGYTGCTGASTCSRRGRPFPS